MPSTIGYARVSSTGQDLAIQEEELRKAGCNTIRSEKRSATAIKGRSELQTILDFIHAGDVLVVTSWTAWPVRSPTLCASWNY